MRNKVEKKIMPQTAMVVGGTSGLGLELAMLLSRTHKVFITGRKNPQKSQLTFIHLDLGSTELTHRLEEFVNQLPHIDLLIYAAGYYQEGAISELSDHAIDTMMNVGLVAPAKLLKRILRKQQSLPGLIVITSTSQWTPRTLEPVYTAVKAGLGMLANSLSLDHRIDKTLVAAPAGMATPFWEGTKQDTSEMLDPKLTAGHILRLFQEDFKYKFARLLRKPPRVEIVEERMK